MKVQRKREIVSSKNVATTETVNGSSIAGFFLKFPFRLLLYNRWSPNLGKDNDVHLSPAHLRRRERRSSMESSGAANDQPGD